MGTQATDNTKVLADLEALVAGALTEAEQKMSELAKLAGDMPGERDKLVALESRIQDALQQVETERGRQEEVLQSLGGRDVVVAEEQGMTPQDETKDNSEAASEKAAGGNNFEAKVADVLNDADTSPEKLTQFKEATEKQLGKLGELQASLKQVEGRIHDGIVSLESGIEKLNPPDAPKSTAWKSRIKGKLVAAFAAVAILAVAVGFAGGAGLTGAFNDTDTSKFDTAVSELRTDMSALTDTVLELQTDILGLNRANILQPDGTILAGAELEIGQMVEGKGIFAGTWEPEDRAGDSLNKTFNLYAAPEDIGVQKTFDEAVEYVAGIKDLLGHDGFNHNVKSKTTDEALYDVLRSGTYGGEWFIAPKDALNANLYANKDKGDLKGTFKTEYDGRWYFSSTEDYRGFLSHVWNQRFSDGNDDWNHKDFVELSTRPVRAELRP